MAPNAHVMTVSRNGQVSIPTETGARWQARRVVLVDLGDRVVLRPLSEQPIADLEGKHRGRGPRTDEAEAGSAATERCVLVIDESGPKRFCSCHSGSYP